MIATLEPKPAGKSVEELQRTISASRLNTWLSCRLKFYFRYVLGLTKPKTGALYIGTSVHSALKRWNQARWRKEPLTVETLKQHFDQLWKDEQPTEKIEWEPDEEAEAQQTAWSLVDLYLKQTPIPANEQPEGVEVRVEADLTSKGLPVLIAYNLLLAVVT